MSYPADSVGFVGQIMLWAGCVASALTWVGGRLAGAFEGVGLVSFRPPDDAASNALWLGLAGIATIVVNGVVAIFKNRGETDHKIAASEDRVAARVAEALRVKEGEDTEKRHAERQKFNNKILEGEIERRDLQAKIAILEARLGLTGATHAVAINATAENVEALADKTHTVLPAPTPHVEPTGSADDLLAHQPPR